MKHSNKIFSFLALTIFVTGNSFAQEIPKQKTIHVTSTFKPVLRDAVKINFTASPPVADTNRPRLDYSIPNQNLYFTYKPVSLKPMALDVDSITRWENSNFVKLGFGNYATPFAQAGFTFSDGEGAALNIYANHVSSRGNLDFQDYSQTGLNVQGVVRNLSNQEWSAGIKLLQDNYYRYGLVPKTLPIDKDTLKVRYQQFGGSVGFRNIAPTASGITYHPQLAFSVFNDNYSNTENSVKVTLPAEKSFDEHLSVHLTATLDLNNYKRKDEPVINNTLFAISPTLNYITENINLKAGIKPAWDNSAFSLLPNITAEIGTSGKEFAIQAGWIGYFNKTSFQNLSDFNPWIMRPDSLLNNRIIEFYGGIKGTLGSNFSYGAKVGLLNYRNTALLVNDLIDGKTFEYINEEKMKALQLAGEIAYTRGEAFHAKAGLNMRNFSGLNKNAQAWGLIPSEINASLRWEVFKDFYFKADMFAWEGAHYRRPDLSADKLSGGFDLNAGAEFRISNGLSVWLQMNNMLNNKYERWHQYEVLGFNILGGVIFRFSDL